MTQRAPVFSGVPARAQPTELLTWARGLPPGRIGDPVPVPIRDRDIRNPLPKPQNLELRFWANSLPPGIVSLTLPQRKTEWPNPVLARQNYELRTWIHSQQIPQPATNPFNQFDWPNPQPKYQNLELRTWIETLPPGRIGDPVPTPIRNRDWPNPTLPAGRSVELSTWLRSQQIPQPAAAPPFVQTDWPNPQLPRISFELRTWLDGLPPGVIALTIPKAQWDWPDPTLAKQPGIDLRSWSQGLPPGAISLTVPPNQYDWPNPLPKAPNLELRSWSQSPAVPPTIAFPLNQYDWPVPAGARPLTLSYSAALDLPLAAVIVPNVVGETQAQATTDITAVGLGVNVSTAYSDTVAAGLVVSQSPVAGTQATLGDTVLIVISLGPQPVQTTVDAGIGRRRRHVRTIYRVTVDGEPFEFKTYEAAVAFLRKAQETANELAAKTLEDAIERQSKAPVEIPIPTLKMPEITASTRELRQEITETKRAIAATYERAQRDTEIAIMFELVKRKQEEDEEIFWLF